MKMMPILRTVRVRLLVIGALLLCMQVRGAEFTVVVDSALFTLDTRLFDWPHVTGKFNVVADSSCFVLDTRRLGVGTVAESTLFVINTKGGIWGGLAGRVLGGGVPLQGHWWK